MGLNRISMVYRTRRGDLCCAELMLHWPPFKWNGDHSVRKRDDFFMLRKCEWIGPFFFAFYRRSADGMRRLTITYTTNY